MDSIYEELTKEQRCAVLGFAIDFCGCKSPSQRQFAELQQLLENIYDELGVSREDVEEYVAKMQSNGKLTYAINTLKTINNERMYGSFYPYFYSVVATLGSREGLAKLDKIYNDEFGYDKDDIKVLWDLYEIKDFRTTSSPSTYETITQETNKMVTDQSIKNTLNAILSKSKTLSIISLIYYGLILFFCLLIGVIGIIAAITGYLEKPKDLFSAIVSIPFCAIPTFIIYKMFIGIKKLQQSIALNDKDQLLLGLKDIHQAVHIIWWIVMLCLALCVVALVIVIIGALLK